MSLFSPKQVQLTGARLRNFGTIYVLDFVLESFSKEVAHYDDVRWLNFF